MTKITLHGAVDEIGGNKVLVEHGDTSLLLDFGTRMGYESDFFAEFLGTRTNTDLKDKITIEALPRIPGIYREDLIRPRGLDQLFGSEGRVLTPENPYFALGVPTAEDYASKFGKPAVDAILLTHAHLDHSGDIGYIHHQVPLYCSKETETLIHAIDDVTTFKTKALTSALCDLEFSGDRSTFPGTPRISKKERIERQCITLEDGATGTVGDVNIKLVSVDHSVPGASSFVLETGSNRILYTGDIRFHGNIDMTVDDYVEKVGPIDVMLCEGTRVDSENALSEGRIRKKITKQMASVTGLVFIDFAWKDTTRYETVRIAAERTGRTLVINARLAYLLDKLGIPLGGNVKVFLKRKGSCLYSPADYTNYKHEYGFSVDWKEGEIDSSHYEDGITAAEITEQPGFYALMLSFFDLGQLFDLVEDDGKISDSLFIKAQCEPFSGEMEIDEARLINWLKKFGIKFVPGDSRPPDGCRKRDCDRIHERIDRSHVSGHASRPELKELIEKIGPKLLIPMHTENAKEFETIASEIEFEQGIAIKVKTPVLGEEIEIEKWIPNEVEPLE